MLLAVRISSYGCTWEVWRALKKLEFLSAAPRATLTLLSCSPNFPRASITRYTHAKHEPILNLTDHVTQTQVLIPLILKTFQVNLSSKWKHWSFKLQLFCTVDNGMQCQL